MPCGPLSPLYLNPVLLYIQTSFQIAYECINKACDPTTDTKDKDWGYYSMTDGNCDECKDNCIRDEFCQSVECGDSYCRWWKNGKCNEVHELTEKFDGSTITCLKDLIGNKTQQTNHCNVEQD